MKTEIEIKTKLKSIKQSLQLEDSATVEENAPLALAQIEREGMVKALKWVLGERT